MGEDKDGIHHKRTKGRIHDIAITDTDTPMLLLNTITTVLKQYELVDGVNILSLIFINKLWYYFFSALFLIQNQISLTKFNNCGSHFPKCQFCLPKYI